MCRLFGLSAGPQRVRATFWLLEAPDSLAMQSRRYPDGYGLGTFEPNGAPVVSKRPAAAYEDELFAREARDEISTTFIAHVRYATTGDVKIENTHPFEQHGRLFAHNGVIHELTKLEERIGDYLELVQGQTDSERIFALVTKEIEATDGDVKSGITRAAEWIADELPVFSINFVLTTPTSLWAFRYPDNRDLFVLERVAGGGGGGRHLENASAAGTVRVRSGDLADYPCVVVASEPMDEDRAWSAVQAGELLQVDQDLNLTRHTVLGDPPRQLLRYEDLRARAAASQDRRIQDRARIPDRRARASA